MKIALLQIMLPAYAYQWSLPPLGLGWIISALKRALPGRVELAFFTSAEVAAQWRPDVAAITSDSGSIPLVVEAARFLKEHTSALTVLGGVHLTSLPHRLPDAFDLGVVGEGEVTFVELVQLLLANTAKGATPRRPSSDDLRKVAGLVWHGSGGQTELSPARTLIADLDSLPFPDRDLLGGFALPNWLRMHVITSRGCPYQCSFCSSSALWPGVRQTSAVRMVEEIEDLYGRFAPLEIYIFDDLMLANRKRLREVGRLLRERGLDRELEFRVFCRANLVDEELVELLGEYNFRYVDFGFESNCEKSLRYYNKTGVTPEVNQRAVDLVSGAGLSVGANLILGAADETHEDIEQTWNFLEHNAKQIERVSCGVLCPFPGTKVWAEATERGLVSDDMDFTRLCVFADPHNARPAFEQFPLLNSRLTRDEIFDWYLKFQKLGESMSTAGELKYWQRMTHTQQRRKEQLQSKLDSMAGSRIVQSALRVRELFNSSGQK